MTRTAQTAYQNRRPCLSLPIDTALFAINQKLAENMTLAISEMEKANLENKKTQKFMQGLYDEAKTVFQAEAQRHEASFQASLNEKFNEISNEARKQTDKILRDTANQSKVLSQISEEFGKQIEKFVKTMLFNPNHLDF